MAAGRRVKPRYLTQAKTRPRPPSSVIFANRPRALPGSYRRYLRNGLRRAFALDGVPLRLYLREGENPYVLVPCVHSYGVLSSYREVGPPMSAGELDEYQGRFVAAHVRRFLAA